MGKWSKAKHSRMRNLRGAREKKKLENGRASASTSETSETLAVPAIVERSKDLVATTRAGLEEVYAEVVATASEPSSTGQIGPSELCEHAPRQAGQGLADPAVQRSIELVGTTLTPAQQDEVYAKVLTAEPASSQDNNRAPTVSSVSEPYAAHPQEASAVDIVKPPMALIASTRAQLDEAYTEDVAQAWVRFMDALASQSGASEPRGRLQAERAGRQDAPALDMVQSSMALIASTRAQLDKARAEDAVKEWARHVSASTASDAEATRRSAF